MLDFLVNILTFQGFPANLESDWISKTKLISSWKVFETHYETLSRDSHYFYLGVCMKNAKKPHIIVSGKILDDLHPKIC